MSRYAVLLLVLVFGLMIHSSCVKSIQFYTGDDINLKFSTDTLRFDTVFTTQGSATRLLKVFNSRDEPIRIKRIHLEDNTHGYFKMNIDGIPGNDQRDIEILGKDSIYIFVEVTIDPDLPVSISPFVITEAIAFQFHSVSQRLPVEAWGQNAIYIPNNSNSKGLARLTCAMGEVVWDDPRPYVIFGALLIDSCVLRIQQGTRVFIHGGVAGTPDQGFYTDGVIYTQPDGVLRIEGTVDQPVVLRTDRLEPAFDNTPGQWGGIRLGPSSKGHRVSHARILHSVVGILIDSAATLEISSSEIAWTTSSGLLSYAGDITADNLLFHHNGRNGIQLSLGGRHRFDYCTIANFNNQSDAVFASNLYCLDPLCQDFYLIPMDLEMRNCIITGNQKDEMNLIDGTEGALGAFVTRFSHSYLRLEDFFKQQQWSQFMDQCPGCILYNPSDKLFFDLGKDDYTLDSMSVVRKKGVPIPELPLDIRGHMRDGVTPDMGCYAY